MPKHSMAVLLGRVLRTKREAAGLSQDQFADQIDMHRAYYASIERGEKNVTLKTFKRIADGLHVAMSDLLRETNN